MNPALISLHRQGVFRQPWSTLTLFTSDFGLSLVDYFPLIPKITVVSVAIHNFRNNYPSAVDICFICSLLDMEFCPVQKKKQKQTKKKKKNNFKIQQIGVPNTEYTCCPVGWLGEAKVSCILRHRGVQLIFAYRWARPAIFVEGKGRGGMFYFFCFFTFIHFPFFPVPLFHLLYCLLSLFSLSLGDDTK